MDVRVFSGALLVSCDPYFTCAHVCYNEVVVERERATRSYRLSSFYLGKAVAELPFNMVTPLLFGCVVYWAVGLNPLPGHFFKFLVILLLTAFSALGLGMVRPNRGEVLHPKRPPLFYVRVPP